MNIVLDKGGWWVGGVGGWKETYLDALEVQQVDVLLDLVEVQADDDGIVVLEEGVVGGGVFGGRVDGPEIVVFLHRGVLGWVGGWVGGWMDGWRGLIGYVGGWVVEEKAV